VIPEANLCSRQGSILKYSGIKEDVYAWKLRPDPGAIRELGVRDEDLVITVRPPATEAHYHNAESEALFSAFMDRACELPETRMVLLPRNKRQGELIRTQFPRWFEQNKTVVPRAALDGLNLIWHSDLVVSGGGTMNREAAALGVPVYSIFRGTIGGVDRTLSAEGRLVLIESVQDVRSKIALSRRSRKPLTEVTSRRTLMEIVDAIEQASERCLY
jgi:predicted glycosyltransferase